MEDKKGVEVSAERAAARPKKYQVNAIHAWRFPNATTVVPADLTKRVDQPNIALVSVALGEKELTHKIEGTEERPPSTLIVKPATQAQLKYLFEVEKVPYIEESE